MILDANERVGDSWRKRWPSLRLYSPAANDGLPGMRFRRRANSYPTGLEMADYLESYAKRFELPVGSGTTVESLERNGERIRRDCRRSPDRADNVVVATGVFQPSARSFPSSRPSSIRRFGSSTRPTIEARRSCSPARCSWSAPPHSGGDIAFEVARAGHATVLSGRDTGQIPFRVDSRRMRTVWPVLRFVWTHVLTVDTPIGRKLKPEIRSGGGPLLRQARRPRGRRGRARLRASGRRRERHARAGRRSRRRRRERRLVHRLRKNWYWIHFPISEGGGRVSRPEARRRSSVPGLYFIGMPFLHAFSSMLVLGAGRDASVSRSTSLAHEPARKA